MSSILFAEMTITLMLRTIPCPIRCLEFNVIAYVVSSQRARNFSDRATSVANTFTNVAVSCCLYNINLFIRHKSRNKYTININKITNMSKTCKNIFVVQMSASD